MKMTTRHVYVRDAFTSWARLLNETTSAYELSPWDTSPGGHAGTNLLVPYPPLQVKVTHM